MSRTGRIVACCLTTDKSHELSTPTTEKQPVLAIDNSALSVPNSLQYTLRRSQRNHSHRLIPSL